LIHARRRVIDPDGTLKWIFMKITLRKLFLSSNSLWLNGLLFARVWFGMMMVLNGKFLFTEIDFFEHWFTKLHFPFPLFLAYLAKGAEFFGGLFLILGFMTRVAGFLVAFTMFIATFTANKGNIFVMDGLITFAYMWFGLVFMFCGPGKWSLDYLLFDRRKK
jgi:putative oxidoreductase